METRPPDAARTGHDARPRDAARRLDAYFAVSRHVAQRLARGEADAAIAVLRRELARTETMDDPEGSGFLYAMLAVCHGRSGDPEGALAVLKEMEAALPEDAATALRLAEGHLLLLGETGPAAEWARRARERVGPSGEPDQVERRGRAFALEARALLEGGRREEALACLRASELPDPEVAGALLDAGVAAASLREVLVASLPRHDAHERTGAAPGARSEEIRRLLRRLEDAP